MNIQRVDDSETVLINSLVQQKIAAGIKIYNLSAGEPKLVMPKFLIDSACKAMQENKIFYPPASGISELRILASEWLNKQYGCAYQSENCLVVNGGKFGIYLLLQLLLSKDDEVLMAAPYWVSYPAITRIFGGRPVMIETNESQGWKLTPEKVQQACTSRTKILILNNGANPTGTLYTKTELDEILKIAKQHHLFVISDEVYSSLTFDNAPYISCGSFNSYQDNVMVIQSCSKNFAMTGWRIGFVFAHANIIKPLTALVSQSTSGVTTLSQWVAVAALQNEALLNDIRDEMQKRRDILSNALNNELAIKVSPPASALYIFISLKTVGVNMPSAQFCKKVLEEANVALVPGAAFGQEGYIRMSFGAEEWELQAGIKALAHYLQKNNI